MTPRQAPTRLVARRWWTRASGSNVPATRSVAALTAFVAGMVAGVVVTSPCAARGWDAGGCVAADLNGNGAVDGADLGLLLAGWGQRAPGDLDGDGTVAGSDLGILLAAWGQATPAPGTFPTLWINGGPACPNEPKIQIHHYDANTVILRQSLCTNFEAPFMYLLFGEDKVLMQDTGAGGIQIYTAVKSIIDQWLLDNGKLSIQLIVSHSHGHGDHVAGDSQFVGKPNVTMVGTSQTAVKNFFGIVNWPTDIVAYDLGGRIFDVIPIPGHQAAHIALYDRQTGLLFTGDTLYPGRLYISNFAQYRESIDRLVDFVDGKPVCWVLGTHIEMSKTPGVDFPIGSTHHPNERPLQLERHHLLELQSALHEMAGAPHYEIHDDFIIFPLGGAAARGDGDDCCDRPRTAFELRRVLRKRE